MAIEVDRDGDVLVATWRDGENRVNPASLDAIEAVCEQVERTEGPCALVLTGEGRFFSNGLDLEALAGDGGALAATVSRLHRVLGRLYVLPCYTVAAVNGHAFAAGAMLTCALDHRVMREDRGYWCLNEAQLGLPLTAQMTSAVLGRLPRAAGLEAMLTARRYTGQDALDAGIVDELAEEGRVLELAVARAAAAATLHRDVVATHKRLAHGDVARACGVDVA